MDQNFTNTNSSRSPQKRKVWLWMLAVGTGAAILMGCFCLGLVLLSNAGNDEKTSVAGEEATAPQTPKKAASTAIIQNELDIDIEAVPIDQVSAMAGEMSEIDSGIDTLLAWALAEGYVQKGQTSQVDGSRATLPGGEEVRAFYVGTPANPEKDLVFLQVASPSVDGVLRGRSLVARMGGTAENPILTLFDQDGQVVIDGKQFKFSTETTRLDPFQPPILVGFAPDAADTRMLACTTTGWQEYMACFVSSNNNSLFSIGLSCPSALVVAYAAWTDKVSDSTKLLRAASVITVINACGIAALTCLDDSLDNAPTANAITDLTWVEPEWRTCAQDDMLEVSNRYQIVLDWSDDRLPFPDDGKKTYDLSLNHSWTASVKDCGGNYGYYEVDLQPASDIRKVTCAENEICRDYGNGFAACEQLTEELPPAQPNIPVTKHGLIYERTSQCEGSDTVNIITLKFNSGGGPVTGTGATEESCQEFTDCPDWVSKATYTLEGNYDAVLKTMEGKYSINANLQTYGPMCEPWAYPYVGSGTWKATTRADGTITGTFYDNETQTEFGYFVINP